MQQQQEQAQYYDKLLHHLNRTFLMNIKAQELFLDLTKHTHTIHFKSIKNIYHTLTEGKADEVIYGKDKAQLISNHVFNQKFTQRTCWRIIEKLVTKVAYYLSHEHLLSGLAPSIMKVMSFLRTANEKINNRASFVMFFQEVLDCVIAENNMLEEKIYDLLIKRGYIYSIDEFYRLNRFEGTHEDYVCPEQGSGSDIKEEENSLEVAGKSIETSSITISKRSKSRFVGFSSRKAGAFGGRSKSNFEEENIPEESEAMASVCQTDSQPEQQGEIKAEQFNRLSHNIHQQVEKTVEELLNNNKFDAYMSTNRSQDHVNSLHDSNTQSFKPPLVKQLLKNLKNRNFKANQKILVINSDQIDKGKEEQRKNSSQTLLKNKKSKSKMAALQKNRTSIAVALNNGMRDRIFKNQHLADIEDLIINNLDKLEGSIDSVDHSTPLNKNFKRNFLFRSKARQHTQMFPVNNEESLLSSNRRSSNIQFLSNAFNFQGKIVPKNSYNQVRRLSNFGPECHMSEISSNLTIQTVSHQDREELIEKYVSNRTPKKFKKEYKQSYISGISQGISRFASQFKESRELLQKQNRFFCHHKVKSQEFNPTLLKITAQKYNKCITEQHEPINNLQIKDLNILTSIRQFSNMKSSSSLKSTVLQNLNHKFEYQHHKKYDVYDRKLRRIL